MKLYEIVQRMYETVSKPLFKFCYRVRPSRIMGSSTWLLRWSRLPPFGSPSSWRISRRPYPLGRTSCVTTAATRNRISYLSEAKSPIRSSSFQRPNATSSSTNTNRENSWRFPLRLSSADQLSEISLKWRKVDVSTRPCDLVNCSLKYLILIYRCYYLIWTFYLCCHILPWIVIFFVLCLKVPVCLYICTIFHFKNIFLYFKNIYLLFYTPSVYAQLRAMNPCFYDYERSIVASSDCGWSWTISCGWIHLIVRSWLDTVRFRENS